MLERLITHKEHGEGGIQTLEFKDKSGIDHQIGVVPPGKYDFGLARRTECVEILSGGIIIGDKSHKPGEKFTVQPGDKLKFSVEEISSYHSHYPNT